MGFTPGSGGQPSGTAGGDLTGTYPNPTVAALAVTNAKMAAGAAAANLGAAGGVLGGTYPSPTMAAGAAATNLGAAGGDLSGTFPSPSIAALAVTNAKMAAGAAVANIGSHGVTSLLLAAEFLALPRLIATGNLRLQSAATAATPYALWPGWPGATSTTNVDISNNSAGSSVFYFDPAVYALTGLTTTLRLDASLLTNATAPTVTFTIGLYPVTAVAGASGANTVTIGAVVSGCTVAFTTPSGSTSNQAVTTGITPPNAGYYALAVSLSGTAATNSTEAMYAHLSVYWV